MKTKFFNALSLAVIMAMLITSLALASDVDVSIVDLTTAINSVTLAPGGSGPINFTITVTGNQAGTATFQVNRDWTLSNGTFTGSNPQMFTVPPRVAQDPATVFTMTGTVTVAAGENPETKTLAVAAFNITNSNQQGGKLAAGDSSDYDVTVSAPPPSSDTTAPVITPNVVGTLGNNGWSVSDVTVSWKVEDNESSISSSNGCDSTTIDYDTTGVTLTCTATNAGGTSSQYVTIKRDATAPSVSVAPDRGPDYGAWYNQSVHFTVAGSDSLSGVASCDVGFDYSTDNATAQVNASCVDNAGNVGNGSYDFMYDGTVPSISYSVSPDRPISGWWNIASGAPTATFTCNDATAGIESCEGTHLFGEGENQSFTGNAKDNAGNTASIDVTDIDVDLTAPVVIVTGVSNGATYILGSVPVAGCSTTDALSGVTTPASLSMSGGPVVGSFTATCSGASDNAGNLGTASATYKVIYNWNGFFQPIDNNMLNVVKAGSGIPVKFSLSGNQGLNIFAAGYPSSTQVACGNSAEDAIETTVTTGGSSLSYDALADQYVYVWKTEKSWAGTCRTLVMKLNDGTFHYANFKFK